MSTLRTFRVLRPLNLVSGVPSKHYFGLGLIPRLKSAIRTASAICWNYLGLFRSATAKALLDVAALRLRLRSYFLGVKFSTLRTFRVFRPLKLVSGVPSKHYFGLGLIPTKIGT